MEDQLGVLGLLLNAVVLFNTRYMDAAVDELRAHGFDVRDEDVARLSPFVGSTSTSTAGTRSRDLTCPTCPTCPGACAHCGTRTPPTRAE